MSSEIERIAADAIEITEALRYPDHAASLEPRLRAVNERAGLRFLQSGRRGVSAGRQAAVNAMVADLLAMHGDDTEAALAGPGPR